jgi:hypothetical protein
MRLPHIWYFWRRGQRLCKFGYHTSEGWIEHGAETSPVFRRRGRGEEHHGRGKAQAAHGATFAEPAAAPAVANGRQRSVIGRPDLASLVFRLIGVFLGDLRASPPTSPRTRRTPCGLFGELFKKLEVRAVPRIRVEDQPGIRQMLLKDVGIDGRRHDVAVDDERALLDLLQISSETLTPPYFACQLK